MPIHFNNINRLEYYSNIRLNMSVYTTTDAINIRMLYYISNRHYPKKIE